MKLSPTELEAANELADHITRAMVVAGRKVGQVAFEMVAASMPKETLSPRTMHKGSPGGSSAGDTLKCQKCGIELSVLRSGYCEVCFHGAMIEQESVSPTFPCYNCDQPVQRIHAKPDEGWCARCEQVVSERPPLMPGRPDTFLCPKGHVAKRIMWSLNGWCDECGDIVEEEE